MRESLLRHNLAQKKPIINAWLSMNTSYGAEGVGHAGFDAVTLDMQHGMIGFSDVLVMLQALSSTPATPIVRVLSLDPAQIMHVLDAGAYGVICPMISTPQQAQDFIEACLYPPFGQRSYGPTRGLLYGGPDYVSHANDVILPIPMIETMQALENLDDILSVKGVEMIFIGPNDLALNVDGHVSTSRPKSEATIMDVLARAHDKGVAVGIFCADANEARQRVEQGFDLVTPGNDFGTLTRGYKVAIHHVRGNDSSQEEAHNGGY